MLRGDRDGAPHFAGVRPARFTPEDLALDQIVPDSSTAGFDMEVVVRTVLDDGDFLETSELYGRALMVGFGCIDGSTVRVVASRPTHIGGALDGDTSDKTARFIRFCDAVGCRSSPWSTCLASCPEWSRSTPRS